MYIMLLNAGATQTGAWLEYHGQSIRIINGGGRGLAVVKGKYLEPTTAPQPDIVVCAGAYDVGVPARVIAVGRGASTVHPTPGGGASWLTLEEARVEFGL